MGKKRFYAVAVGRQTGVFSTWEECQKQVSGFSGARFKSFLTLQEAQAYASGVQDVEPGSVGTSLVADSHTPVLVGVKRALSLDVTLDAVEVDAADDGNEVDDESKQQVLSPEWVEARKREAVVVYVDGACRNNGSRSRERRPRAGFGGFYGDGDSRNFKFPLPAHEPQTNQRAELSALIHVLRVALDSHPCYNLCVYSDSKYTVMGVNSYLHRWERNGFKTAGGGDVANIDLWSQLTKLRNRHLSRCAERFTMEFRFKASLAAIAARAVALQLKHVPGHAGVYGNEMADRLAVEACESPFG
ncbi:ribonuclease H1 [Trypanosoma brucei brucei TREU927]|uniref:ribonuclease H n=1 Tax=Trypanosoma brucei brucei (strain 927/4 GUTat10.1) TaxID=185431 RepID=Q57XA9_TRYB2|nr:ribonuclease H1 [Trypanosoma brucei brucei TREU927]AAX69760.1 ribonuclease H1 [Trypanosoma brucei]AAZ12557.1 ribonuclease H1 [Trypanosoma brucei brucei TREU927]